MIFHSFYAWINKFELALFTDKERSAVRTDIVISQCNPVGGRRFIREVFTPGSAVVFIGRGPVVLMVIANVIPVC